MMDEDFFQWGALIVLMLISITTCTLSISTAKQGKEIHQMKGKVDLISDTYTSIFKGMHERLTAAIEKDE